MSTKIHWCDETINPIVGCSKISAGCQNCYAENMARRLAAMGLRQYCHVMAKVGIKRTSAPKFGGWNGKTAFVPSELEKPYRWGKPRSIFVCSMGDAFHESVDDEDLNSIMEMTMYCPQHTFIFLTKRPQTMFEYFRDFPYRLKNVVLGVSVENQQTADERIPVLLQIPTAKRFISIEPMLGPVQLPMEFEYFDPDGFTNNGPGAWHMRKSCIDPDTRIDGVILGGESGPKARPLHPDWVRSVRDQCAAAGVSFMFKQWGEWLTQPYEHGYNNLGTLSLSGSGYHKWPGEPFIDTDGVHYGSIASKVGIKMAGRFLDGRTHDALCWKLKN